MRRARPRQVSRGTTRSRRVRVRPLWKELSTDELAKALAVYLSWQAAQPSGDFGETLEGLPKSGAAENPAGPEGAAASDDCPRGGQA